jgi:hypothetical protein
MKRFLSFSLATFCCLCLLMATEHRAYAYVDPGSGLLAIQSMFAALGAAGYFLRRRIAGLFGRKKPAAEVVTAPVPQNVMPSKSTRTAA